MEDVERFPGERFFPARVCSPAGAMLRWAPTVIRRIFNALALATAALSAWPPSPVRAQVPAPPRLSALASEPDWSRLEQYQGTMDRAQFMQLLDTVYAPGGAWKQTISIALEGAHILTTGSNRWLLKFASDGNALPQSPAQYWRPLAALPKGPRPLEGVKIALDPGHLGGKWARMEERWFQLGADTVPVAEGDMTLLTARLLAAKLTRDGAQVVFVHNHPEPLTALRPADLRDAAREQLRRQGMAFIRDGYDGPGDPLRMNSIQWTS